MPQQLTLISHRLCPYVQRAAIALAEKGMAFHRIDIDLANKPDWFLSISPLGKTPVLQVGDVAIFESAVILEYLEETGPNPLHPTDALERALHRGWIEFASSVLNDIGSFYNAANEEIFAARSEILADKFARLELQFGSGPFFAGDRFSLVDVVFAPVFRYFDVFDQVGNFAILAAKPKLAAWRGLLRERPSVKAAVGHDYPERLLRFVLARRSHLSRLAERSATDLPIRVAD